MSQTHPTSRGETEIVDCPQVCRVCLNPKTKSAPLMQLCLCRGSIRYQHADCANSWLQAQLRNKKPSDLEEYAKQGYPCEICHHPITIRLKEQIHCLDWTAFKRAVTEELCVSGVYIVVELLLLVLLGVTIWLQLAQRELGMVGEGKMMVVIALVMEAILLLVVGGLFLKRFVVKEVQVWEVVQRRREMGSLTTFNVLEQTLGNLKTCKERV